MVCDACGNPTATRMRFFGGGKCGCDKCLNIGSIQFSDVYFREPYLDPNLVDPTKPEQKNGVWIESREQKADIMRRLGWREAGDKKHGCRIEDKQTIRRERERLGVKR